MKRFDLGLVEKIVDFVLTVDTPRFSEVLFETERPCFVLPPIFYLLQLHPQQ